MLATVRVVVGSHAHCLVVDDASEIESAPALLAASESAGASIYRFQTNGGIGRSLNQGVRWAEELNLDLLVTLDQDTIIAEGYLDEIEKALRLVSLEGASVGLITAGLVNGNTRWHMTSGSGFWTALEVMQSGCAYPMHVFARVGDFREDLAMDCVDTDMCVRLRQMGMILNLVPSLNLTHELGQTRHGLLFGRTVKFRGRELTSSNHSLLRRYYMARNRTYLHLKYWRTDRQWVLYSLRGYTKDLIKVFLFEKNRTNIARAALRGTVDGLRGNLGLRRSV